MKKTKRQNKSERAPAKSRLWWRQWWTWTAALAALFVVFEVYEPALNGKFVFDDRYLPFFDPNVKGTLFTFVGNLRPLLMLSFWIDFHRGDGADPRVFHSTNVFLHFLTSILVTLIVLRILDWAAIERRMRVALAIFAGALFLLHPLQTESVAYVASRSEILSVFFYYAAFAAFVWRGSSMTWLRAVAILLLFVAAAATKEHTLTLPLLMILTDLFWNRGLRKNAILYGMLAVGAVIGGIYVGSVLRHASTAGFNVPGVTVLAYFFTQCRVIWIYLRLIVLPVGQTIDPEVATSHGFDPAAIIGLLALAAVAAAAWIYRRRWPLASFGFFVFLLLLAPTSSLIPIKDVMAEHRLYLPFLGLTLIACDVLRRTSFPQAVAAGSAALLICCAATYHRNQVWSTPLSLWQDAVAKAPDKYRPRFQLAYEYFSEGLYADAVKNYELASKLGPVDDQLLIDWGLALSGQGHADQAIQKMRAAAAIHNTAHVHTQIAVTYAQQKRYEDARAELMIAQGIDPNYDMTYAYLGSVEEAEGNHGAARAYYLHALQINPQNQLAHAGLERASQ